MRYVIDQLINTPPKRDGQRRPHPIIVRASGTANSEKVRSAAMDDL